MEICSNTVKHCQVSIKGSVHNLSVQKNLVHNQNSEHRIWRF